VTSTVRKSLVWLGLWLVASVILPAGAAADRHAAVAHGRTAAAVHRAAIRHHLVTGRGTKRAQPTRPPSFGVAASRGIQELMGSSDYSPVSWNPKTALWGGQTPANWWQSALAITTLVRYAERTGSAAPSLQRVLVQTYRRNIYRPHTTAPHEFANQFLDDTAWWGLAWLTAAQYELTYRGDVTQAGKFLAVAEWDAGYIAGQSKPCGGIAWSIGTPPDTISNAEFVALTAGLYRIRDTIGPFYNASKASSWLAAAQSDLSWLKSSGLINLQAGSVLDSLDSACHPIGGSLTYTEGEVAEALTQMGNALGDPSYYDQAAAFLRYTINPASGLVSNGVLQEHCEAVVGACGQVRFRLDLPAYKGLFVNAVADWEAATGNHAFDPFLRAQATAVIQNAIRGPNNDLSHCGAPHTCEFSFHWTGARDPAPLGITLGGQESALDALTSVLPQQP
jgi:Glycosyl hydrolase family 76